MISCNRDELEQARARAQAEADHHRARWLVMLPDEPPVRIDQISEILSREIKSRILEFQRVLIPGEGTRWVLATRVRLILSEVELRSAHMRNFAARYNRWNFMRLGGPPEREHGHRVEYCEINH